MRILMAIAAIAGIASLTGCVDRMPLRTGIVNGTGFTSSIDACLIAAECRDLTDEEIDNADSAPGSGFSHGMKLAEEAPYWKEVSDRKYGQTT